MNLIRKYWKPACLVVLLALGLTGVIQAATTTTLLQVLPARGEYGVLYEYTATNLPAGHYWLPSASGSDMTWRDDLTVEMAFSGTVTAAVIGTLDSAGSDPWRNISAHGVSLNTNFTSITSWTDPTDLIEFTDLNISRWRIKIKAADSSNTVILRVRAKGGNQH